MGVRRCAVLLLAGVLAGSGAMYVFTKGRVVEAGQLVVRYHELEKKNRDLETRNATLQIECAAMRHHKDQEGVFYAEALKKGVEVRNLKRRLLSVASRNNDAQAVRELLAQDNTLVAEPASELFKENWLHTIARSQSPGVNQVVKVLIDFGVDREAKNVEGQRPIDVARVSGTWEVIETLQSYKPRDVVRVSSSTR